MILINARLLVFRLFCFSEYHSAVFGVSAKPFSHPYEKLKCSIIGMHSQLVIASLPSDSDSCNRKNMLVLSYVSGT